MSELTEKLRKLSKLKRTRPNFDKISEQIDALSGYGQAVGELVAAIDDVRDGINDLETCLDAAGDDNPLVPWVPQFKDALAVFTLAFGGEGGGGIIELIDELGYARDEYSMVLDEESTADDRQEAWDELTYALENTANGLSVFYPAHPGAGTA